LEALLTTFVAALLAEWGDKTQLLVVALAAHYRRPLPILAGVAVAALANAMIASAGGVFVNGYVVLRAASLLVAVALLFAGVAGFLGGKAPDLGDLRKTGPFLASVGSFFVLEFGDKTQFLTFSLVAQFDSFALGVAGASAGVLAASVPAVLLGETYPRSVPLRPVRIAIACLFLTVGLVVALKALRLV
jgi:putative Ca2+/H+ antiporter (TMEM165/GDT1 family)